MNKEFIDYLVNKKVKFIDRILSITRYDIKIFLFNVLLFLIETKFGLFLSILFLSTIFNIIAIVFLFNNDFSSLFMMTCGSVFSSFIMALFIGKNRKWFKIN